MLFGAQYEEDAPERAVGAVPAAAPSPVRKKKSRNAGTRAATGVRAAVAMSKRSSTRGGASRDSASVSSYAASTGSVSPSRGGGPTSSTSMVSPARPRRNGSSNGNGSGNAHPLTATATATSSARMMPQFDRTANYAPVAATLPPPYDPSTMYPSVWKALQFRKKTIPLASSASVKPICVTGVDGFLASWVVSELLARGYRVRGTVQSRRDDISGIRRLPLASKNFTVVETSLLTPEACDVAVEGCEFVIHTGTPTSCSVRDPISEHDEPGVHSIGSRMHCIIPMMTNFIQACARARVKRVVLTSSIAAMADAVRPDSIVNETSWNITSSLERNPHFLSLKLAEEAAWQLVDQLPRDCRIDLVTINPGTLFGPSLSKSKLAPGNQIIFDLITGQYSALVDLNWSMVDVRDCAQAHVAALENLEARGRYICVNRSVWIKDIVDFLANNGYSGRDLPWRVGLPNWVARLPAYSAQLGQVGAALYAYDPNVARPSPYLHEKVMDNLNIRFRKVDTTIVESAADLLKWGLIKPWAEDHESIDCNICHAIFTFYRRKHHCRECGVIICADCSMSRAVVEGADGKVRLCDRCVKNSIPELLELLNGRSETGQKKAVIALEALMENELNHDYVTRYDGVIRLLRALHSHDEVIASHAAGALVALSVNVSSSLQMVLEGAVLQMLEVEETTRTWAICLQALRNLWKQVNRNDFRKMLHAVARVSTTTNKGDLQGNIVLTFVHMMDPEEVPSLLCENLLSVLFHMLQSEELFPRCAAAHAVKHLVPMDYDPDLTIDVPPYLVDDHEELFANSSLSDLQFLVKGHIAPINAHKVVLFFRNSYFKNMVRFGTATSQHGMIEINNCSYEVFSLLLRFLYTGKVHITPDIAQELLRASSFYHVFELQKRAEAFLADEIRVENVVDLLTLAEECQAIDLKRNCVPFLMRHIHEVVGQPAYREHRMRATEEVLKSLCDMLGEEWEASYSQLMRALALDSARDPNVVDTLRSTGLSVASLDGDPSGYGKHLVGSSGSGSNRHVNSNGSGGGGLTAAHLAPLTTGSSFEHRYRAFTGAMGTPSASPRVVNGAMEDTSSGNGFSANRPYGRSEMLFRGSRKFSDDLSEVMSEGVC